MRNLAGSPSPKNLVLATRDVPYLIKKCPVSRQRRAAVEGPDNGGITPPRQGMK
jgi:hypothetical protein